MWCIDNHNLRSWGLSPQSRCQGSNRVESSGMRNLVHNNMEYKPEKSINYLGYNDIFYVENILRCFYK